VSRSNSAPKIANMPDDAIENFSREGEAADQLAAKGNHKGALAAYKKILEAIEATGQLDSFLLAKLTLGSLRAHIKVGEFQEALEIWNAHMDQSLFGIGVYALENAQTRIDDLIAYDMVCAFLHTMIDGDKNKAAKAVNLYLSRVCEHALESGDRALMVQALSNWKVHLKEIFGGSIPQSTAGALIQFERQFGEAVRPRPIDFPLPTPWQRPKNFRETSTVVSKGELKSRLRKTR
jgi:tetratricopeptide (TPR) repeat protein